MSAASRLGLHLRQSSGVSVPKSCQAKADVVGAPLQQARKVETWEPAVPSAAALQVASGGQSEGASDAGKAQPDLQWLLPSKPKHYTSLITACGTLTELQAVCWTYHSHLTPIQISAAFTTCVRIITGHGSTHDATTSSSSSSIYPATSREAVQLVGWLLDRLSRQRASCSSREVANALWCLAKLRHHPGPVYIDNLLDHFLDVLPTSSSQGISMTLYALAQLQHAPSDAWLAQVVPALTRAAAAEAAAGAQAAQALSNSCWALAALEVPGASRWVCDLLGCAVALAEAQQQQQQQQQVQQGPLVQSREHLAPTSCAAGLQQPQGQQQQQQPEDAQGGSPAGGAAAAATASSSASSEGALKARAALQHLLQQAHLPQEPPPPPSPREALGSQGVQTQEPTALAEQAAGAGSEEDAPSLSHSPVTPSMQLEQVLARRMPFGSQAVANMVWASAAVVQREWEADRWADPSQQQQQYMQWQGSGQAITGRGSCGAAVRTVARSHMARLLQLSAAAGCLQRATPSELAMVAWGAGRLNLVSLPADWWGAFLPATLQQLQRRRWSAQELATLLRGCVRCRVRPAPAWMAAFCAASAAALPAATCCEVCCMVWALGKWGYAPPASWVAAALQRVDQQLPLASSNHLGMLLCGLSRLRYRPQEALLMGLMQRLYDVIPATRDPHILSATLYALQRLQLTPGRDLLRRLVEASCQLLGTMRSEDLVLLLGSLAQLQPAPRVSPGQLWVSLEKERALVQHRVELLRQRMAALQAEEDGAAAADEQQQQQQQQQRFGGQQAEQGRAASPVGGPLSRDSPAAYNTALAASGGGGRQEAPWLSEGGQPGSWLMAGLEDMPPPPVLMQSYLEVMEEGEEEEEEGAEGQHLQQQGQVAGGQEEPGGVPCAPAAAVAVSWRWLEDSLATEHVAIAAAKAAAAAGAAGAAGSDSQQGLGQHHNLHHQQQQQQLQQPVGSGPRWLQNEQWRAQQAQQQAASCPPGTLGSSSTLDGFQAAGQEAEEQLLHAARLLQQAAISERLTEQQYIRVRQKLVVQQRRLSRLYSQQQAALSQGHLLLTTPQVGALFSRAEELLPGMAAVELVAVLRAAAWLGADVSAAPWRAALRRTLLPAVKTFSAPQLVALLWSLVQLQGYLQPGQRLLMAAVARCEELLAVGAAGSQPTGRIQPCSCMQLTQMVWALVRLGCVCYIGPRWARTYVSALSRQLPQMGGQELGVVLRTMVRLRMAPYVPPALLERVELLMEVNSAVWPSSCLGLVAAAVVKLQQQQLLARKMAAAQREAAAEAAAASAAAAAAGAQAQRRRGVSQGGAVRRVAARTRMTAPSSGSASPLGQARSLEQLQAAAARERQLLHVSVSEVLAALAAQGGASRAGRMAALVQDSRAALASSIEVVVQQEVAGAGAAGGRQGAGHTVLQVGGTGAAAGGQGVGGAPPPARVSQELSGVSTLASGSPHAEEGDMQVVYLAV